jgi:hypothetical protein
MKNLKKLVLGALMLTGAAVGASQPAAAGVSVGIGVGIPGPAYYGPAYACDPYYSDYDEYGCGAYYTGPVFIDGAWFNGPLRWRWWGGGRQFWWHGGWRVGTGWHVGGFHGGGFRGGFHRPTVGTGFHGGFHGGGFHGGFHRPTVGTGFHGGVHAGGMGVHVGGGGGHHH